MKKIAIFASGNGSNAENIIKYFANSREVSIGLVLSNNIDAFVIQRAKKLNIPTQVFTRDEFSLTNNVLQYLTDKSIDFIVLAGFMWLVPENILTQYSDKIINIHPALLPKYGGKGMYGNFVHKAVSVSGEKETGITIHFVNEKYDDGAIIFQKSVQIESGENYQTIAEKIHRLEYKYFPQVIEKILLNLSE